MEKFEIKKQAIAGSLESSDCQILIDKNPKGGIEIELKSNVEKQFGRRIREVIESILKHFGIEDAKVVIQDKGALDWTIKARVIAAIYRAAGKTEKIDWEVIDSWNA
ncbi:MAG: citrate lyase acyl carrier protein [Tissierellales bacterium]